MTQSFSDQNIKKKVGKKEAEVGSECKINAGEHTFLCKEIVQFELQKNVSSPFHATTKN